jgi:potassium-dependent mechanosensitive channel
VAVKLPNRRSNPLIRLCRDPETTSGRGCGLATLSRKVAMLALAASTVLLISAVQAYPHGQAPPKRVPTPAGPQPIPASEVAERAEDLKRLLRRIESRLAASPTAEDVSQQINRRGEGLHVSALETDEMVSAKLEIFALREQERYWSTEVGSSAGFQAQLTGRVNALEEQVRTLDGLQAVWEATGAQVKTHNELEPLAERIETALAAIQATKSQAQSQLDELLGLQTRVAEQESLASEMLDEVEGALATFRRQIFERSNLPLWAAPWHHRPATPREGRTARAQALAHLKEFLRRESLALSGLALLFLVLLVIALTWRRKAPAWIKEQQISPAPARIFHRPVSLALVLALAPALPAAAQSPVLINMLVILLLLIAAIRLVPLLVGPNFQPFLYTLLAFFLLPALRLMGTTPFVERSMYALSNLMGLAVFGWLTRRARLKGLPFQERRGRRVLLAIRVGLVLLGVCFLLNFIGYFTLARTLQDVLLVATCLAIVLYCAVRVAVISLSLLLEAGHARSIATIRVREKEILRWATPLLAIAACIFWLDITVDLLTLRVQAQDWATQVLNSSINLGKVTLSLRDALTFIVVLVGGFALSRVVRFFLLEDLLSRIEMQRGLPEVISTTVYYLLVVGVFALALASAGVDFSRFNVLTGAFGLGIGFGLQTVINNFVSGVILKYERRINVGDAVELGSGAAAVAGKVQKVGVRASLIATYDGAEVIVPNSALVTSQVTNWTLSSRTRRSALQIGVAYGTPPQRVIELLVAAATSHPDVLGKPAPSAFFQGFGDNALNFQLFFWTTIDAAGRAKSDVAVVVSEALEQAGIEVPFPQRDLHLRSVEPAVRDALLPENEERERFSNRAPTRSPEKEVNPTGKGGREN